MTVRFLHRIIAEDLRWVRAVRNDATGRFGHCDPRTGETVRRIGTPPAVPARLTTVPMTVDAVGHRRGARILLADGRTPEIRHALFHASTVTLVYTAGPSDTYRRGYVLDVLA